MCKGTDHCYEWREFFLFFRNTSQNNAQPSVGKPQGLGRRYARAKGLRTSLGKTDLSIKKLGDGYRITFKCEREPRGNIYVSIPTEDGARVVTLYPSKNINTIIPKGI